MISVDTGSGMYNYSSNYNPYTTAPTTSHILWTKPEAFGGALGGQFGGTTTYGNYYSTSQYEKKFMHVIINGFLYYNVYPGSSTTPSGLLCVNLYTGQTVWDDNSDNYGGGSPAYNALTSAGLVYDAMARSGTRLCFTQPVWRTRIHMDYRNPCLDHLRWIRHDWNYIKHV